MHMRRTIFGLLVLLFGGMGGVRADAQEGAVPAVVGRWDIVVHTPGREVPSWMEIITSGGKRLVGRYVSGGGSSRPIARVNWADGKMSFSIPPQWESEDRDLSAEGVLQGDSLAGMLTQPNGQQYSWVGHRAPDLRRSGEPAWGKPIVLFDGKDLSGWHTIGSSNNQWVADAGVLRNKGAGSNLVTDGKFSDFKLHIEFRCPKDGNSGVYLRGRYELQIESLGGGQEPPNDVVGAIYGFLGPVEQAAKPSGEWQRYDVTLVGRLVTIVFNGKTVMCRGEIPGITGGALDSNEGEPGPIYLQGDHGPIEFRNVTITPGK